MTVSPEGINPRIMRQMRKSIQTHLNELHQGDRFVDFEAIMTGETPKPSRLVTEDDTLENLLNNTIRNLPLMLRERIIRKKTAIQQVAAFNHIMGTQYSLEELIARAEKSKSE